MFSLALLGKARLEGPDGPVSGPPVQRRQFALLALLATAGPSGRSRDKLQAFLWPESSTESARHSLADAVYRLRTALGHECIEADQETLRLNPLAVSTDVQSFESCLDSGKLEKAVGFYGGPLLDGFHLRTSREFEDWREAESRRLDHRFQQALEQLADAAEGAGDILKAARSWERLSNADPLNSRFAVRWMKTLAGAGDPGNAIQAGEAHARRLREELDAEPPQDIVTLLAGLKAGPSPESGDVATRKLADGSVRPPFEREAEALPAKAPPLFVAREAELARLGGFLDRALAGDGNVAFITGEAGTGKTVLASEFCRRAAEAHPGLVVATGNGNAHTGPGDPFHPFREILALLTGDVEDRYAAGSLTRDHAARLWKLIPASLDALLDAGPDLIDAFLDRARLHARAAAFARHARAVGLRLPGKEAAPTRGLPARQALHLQFGRTLRAVARAHPLLLVVDDLQWADPGSVGLLFDVGRELRGSRILLLGLFRPSDVALGRDGARHPLEPVVNELRSAYGEIDVHLGEDGDRDLVDALVDAEPNVLGPTFRNALFAQTRGHALFTAELLREMRERSALVRDESGRWAADPALDWNVLPGRVDAVIGERIGRLPAPLQRLLAIASVEGEAFTLEAVARVVGADVRELIDVVGRELEKRHRLIVASGLTRLDGERLSVYRFRHILFQRYLYDGLDAVERAHFHERLGLALEALHGAHAADIALALGRHFEAAGMDDKAAHAFLAAGMQCVRASGYPEAAAHIESSLAQLLALPPSRERDVREMETWMALGNARHLAAAPGQYEAFTRVRDLAERLGDERQYAWALLWLYVVLHYGGDHRETARLADVCLAIAKKLDDGALLVSAHEAAGRSAALRGDYPRAIEHFLTVLSLYDPDKHIMRLYMGGLDWSSLATGFIGMAKLRLGYPDQAQKWCSDALALARQRGIAMTVAWTWLYETYVRLGRRDIEESLQAIEAWRAASIEAGVLGFWNPWFELGEGWCQCQRGDAEEAIRLTKAGLDGMLRQGLNIIIPYWTAWVGQALALGGRAEEGLRLLDEARARSTATDEMFVEADTLRIRGDLLLAQREPRVAEAEATYREAIALARTQTTKWFELRATVSLARLLRTRGRSDEARGMLREIHGWFTEGFETQDLKEAAALLAELEEGRSATA